MSNSTTTSAMPTQMLSQRRYGPSEANATATLELCGNRLIVHHWRVVDGKKVCTGRQELRTISSAIEYYLQDR